MAKKKKDKEPARDWILEEVASRGILFRLFAALAAITNGVAVAVIVFIIDSMIGPERPAYVDWFEAAAIGVDIGITLLLVIAFINGFEEFDGSGPIVDAKGNIIEPASGGGAARLRQERLEANQAREEAKKRAKEEKRRAKQEAKEAKKQAKKKS